MITGKLRSDDAAKREIMPAVEHRSHQGLNNRAENSPLAVRRRERDMIGFTSARQCPRFVSWIGLRLPGTSKPPDAHPDAA
jgi:putative transposase